MGERKEAAGTAEAVPKVRPKAPAGGSRARSSTPRTRQRRAELGQTGAPPAVPEPGQAGPWPTPPEPAPGSEGTSLAPSPPAAAGPAAALPRVSAGASFYATLLTETEQADLAAAGDRGLADEVGLLRALARRAVAAGARQEALAIVRALAAALKVQHGLSGRAAKEFDRALAKVLDELSEEL